MTVVTDTSVVLNLCLLRQEAVLLPLFGTIFAPPEVETEFSRLASVDPRFLGLVFPTFIEVVSPASVPPTLTNAKRLHRGEVAALGLAVDRGAELVLMDERAGRAAAGSLGLRCMGLLGILIAARERGLTPPLAPLLDVLQHQARFWFSLSLRTSILQRVGELP